MADLTLSPEPPLDLVSYRVRLDDGRAALIRDLRPDDDRLYPDFAASVTAADHRLRFFSAAGGLGPSRASALTHYDRAAARAYLALDPQTGRMLGVGRVHRSGGADSGEFAVMVRSDLKGLGLGRDLMEAVLGGAEALGLREVWGFVMRENVGMIELGRHLGFTIEPMSDEPGLVRLRRDLAAA